MTVHNRTTFKQADVDQLVLLGHTNNNWRRRRIALYQHPTQEDRVVSVGITYDKETTVIADEPRSDWTIALMYAKNGKTYTSD